MVHLTLSDDDARLIAESAPPVIFIDRYGRRLGQLAPVGNDPASQAIFSNAEIAEMKRRLQEPGTYTSLEEIKQRLKLLEDQ